MLERSISLSRAHARRLRDYYRSAGWPYGDNVEIDLLAAGFITRATSVNGCDAIVVTDLGLAHIAASLERNRRSRDAHEGLVAQTAAYLRQHGRLAYTASKFRVKPAERWQIVKPDVFSIRRTFEAHRCEPTVHEIKAHRSDLLGDLKREDKRNGYAQIASRVTYVLAQGIAEPEEIPEPFGVWVAHADGRLVELRPAEPREITLTPMHWLQLLMQRGDGAPDVDSAQLPLR
ncbi:MAG TPA: hypothetical protein VFS42_01690 [Burkholderiaceae bacterium]|nr:hypothetical protein [Burkholderiaceae bacterium]